MSMQFSVLELLAMAIAAVIVVGALIWLLVERRRTTTADLRQRFGTEYERAVQEHGSEAKGQAKLLDREKRVEKLHIRDLEPADRDRFLEAWKTVQAHFVDDPKDAVKQANDLVKSLMENRGYPVADFEQRAADISVDHPGVTENYRAAHAIASKLGEGDVNKEDLRTAIIHYHALFEELAQAPVVAKKEAA